MAAPATQPHRTDPREAHHVPLDPEAARGEGHAVVPAARLEARAAALSPEEPLPCVGLVLQRVADGRERKLLQPGRGLPELGVGLSRG